MTNHPVFNGHFPGNPVLPGVFIIQLVHELAEEILGRKLLLAEVKKVKFLSVVSPEKGNQITVELKSKLEANGYPIEATAFFMNQPCLKLNARFTAEP